jgi:hypothetical protein
MPETIKLDSAIYETSLLRMLAHSQPPFLTEDLARKFSDGAKKIRCSKPSRQVEAKMQVSHST